MSIEALFEEPHIIPLVRPCYSITAVLGNHSGGYS